MNVAAAHIVEEQTGFCRVSVRNAKGLGLALTQENYKERVYAK